MTEVNSTPPVTLPRSPINMERIQEFDLQKPAIGNGSYGKVYKAMWTRQDTKTEVAVKIFPMKVVESANAFEAEARMSVLLQDNPHCVSIKKAYVSGGKGFLVMDLYSGDLMDIQESIKFNERDCGIIFQQVCKAIQILHRKRVVHMDIKPDNILIDSNNTPFLADFGSAAKIPQGAKFRHATGTEEFAAPEVLAGEPYNPFPADIWSLGVLLYSMLTGKYPKIKNGKYSVNTKLSDPCNDLLGSILQIRAANRPNINELLDHTWLPQDSPTSLELNIPALNKIPKKGKSPRKGKSKTPRSGKSPRKEKKKNSA